MRRFFVSDIDAHQQVIQLPQEESKHISKVLRMQLGDKIEIVNGKGDLFEAEIILNHQKHCQVRITSQKHFNKDAFHIHIAIAPTKNMDRFEYFLEKSTELGIHEITPIICANSERKIIKNERLEKVLIAAMKQSKRLYLPKLNPLTTIEEFIKQHPSGLVAHCYNNQKNELSKALASSNLPVLIGPEGDFSVDEIQELIKNNYLPITLGKTRLRTETAGLYACALLKNYLE